MYGEAPIVDQLGEGLERDVVRLDHDPREANAGDIGLAASSAFIGSTAVTSTPPCRRIAGALAVATADEIEDDVEIADDVGEVDIAVVEHFVGAEPANKVSASSRSRSPLRERRALWRSAPRGDRPRRHRHGSGPAVRRSAAGVDQALPCGETGQGQCGGMT